MAGPEDMPAVKFYSWIESTTQITENHCSQTEQKNRYNNAVSAVAVRTILEVLNAEPSGVIETLSLTVGARKSSRHKLFLFVAAAVAREDLNEDLRRLEPTQVLKRLNALVSKNPFALQTITDNRGVSK